MAITYSDDQLEVITSRDKNLLVAAAAGAGKTSVLVERIIRRIMDPVNPVDIDRILVVTFTTAAAGEMKERIMDALEKKLMEEPTNEHLARQSTLIHNAHITTIDSFCLDILKNNFHKIGVDPAMRVANQGEADLLFADALDNVMEAAYEKGDPEFINLIDCYVKKDRDKVIEDSITSLYQFAMSYPWPEKWLNMNRDEYFIESPEMFLKSDLIRDICESCREKIDCWITRLNRGLEVSKKADGPTLYEPQLEEMITFSKDLRDAFLKNDFTHAGDMLDGYDAPAFSRKKQECNPDLQAEAKEIRDYYRNEIKDLKKAYFSSTFEREYSAMLEAGKTVRVLTDLTVDLIHEFARLKRDRGIIDFTDMEHMAVSILIENYEDMDNYVVTDVAREYQNLYDEVMIDEYQDSNLVQEILLAAVSHQGTQMSPNRFMVGDVKQSIYRFRLARPEIFIEREKQYRQDAALSKVIHLKENYRSRNAVVDSVNKVFKGIMHEETGKIEYTDDEALYAKAAYPDEEDDNTTRLVLVENYGKTVKYTREWESEELAILINDLVGRKIVYDRKTEKNRTAQYKDVAVLLSGPKKWKNNIGEAFEKRGIPYHMEGVGTFYEAHEIQDVINFLRVLDNPLNDIPLYATLTSYFGGFDDEFCARIKGEGETSEYYLWDKLVGYKKRHPDREDVSKFIEFVNEYRKLCTYEPIGDLITKLVTETGYLLYISASLDGRQKEANIELLIKKATDYSKTSFSGIFHFLRYVELLKKTNRDEGEAGIFDENSDTVRVMSIHKSKGLEFPICIVMAIEDSFVTLDQTATFVMDIDKGIGAKAIDPVKRTSRSTYKRNLIENKIACDSLGEEIRLLYVAMTRAREQLILLGAMKDAETYVTGRDDKKSSFLHLIHDSVIKDNMSYFKSEVVYPENFETADAEVSLDRKEARAILEKQNGDEKLIGEIQRAITFDYPYKYLEKLYTKTTVSNLKMDAMEEVQGETRKLFEEREKSEYIPEFAGGHAKVSGTDRGTAYHTLLQLIDFRAVPGGDEWNRQLNEAVDKGLTTKEIVELVNPKRFMAFADTDIARRMHEAALRDDLFKEQPFVMGVPASLVDSDLPKEETVLIQGVIDVFFFEGDEAVILDYKTDKVSNPDELTDRYKAQLDYYADAITKLTGKTVKDKVLYSFGLNETVVVK